MLLRDRPLANLSAALLMRKTHLCIVVISLSRLLLSSSSSGHPSGQPGGKPKDFSRGELVLFEILFVPVPSAQKKLARGSWHRGTRFHQWNGLEF